MRNYRFVTKNGIKTVIETVSGKEYFPYEATSFNESQILLGTANGDLSLQFSELDLAQSVPAIVANNPSELFVQLNSQFFGSLGNMACVNVNTLNDLPIAVEGVINLRPATCYVIYGNVDLLGARLVTSGRNALVGTSSATAEIRSTGLTGQPLISTAFNLSIRNISFLGSGETGVFIDGTETANLNFDWVRVRFEGFGTTVEIDGAANFLCSNGAFIHTGPVSINGLVDTASFTDCLFIPSADGESVVIGETADIQRRVRFSLCAFVVGTGRTGISVHASATIPIDQFILISNDFSGAGTYITGVLSTDNTADWRENKGIENTATAGSLFMQDNAVATTIATLDTFVKVAGTTTGGEYVKRFAHSNNRLTYNGALEVVLKVQAFASLTSGANNVISVAIYKNGAFITGSAKKTTASAGGRAESVATQVITKAVSGDYFEVFVANGTGTTNVTLTDLQVAIEQVK